MKTPYSHTPSRAEANTTLRRDRDERRRRELVLVVLALLPLALGLIAYTWIELETLAAGYRITERERELRDLTKLRQQLEMTAAGMTRRAAVEVRASDKLGLVRQTPAQTLFYEEIP